MTDFLIVGFGNTLRGDDGIGPYVASNLDIEELPPHVSTRILCLPQLDISLAAILPEVDVAIFVDARNDAEIQAVKIDQIVPSMPSVENSCLTHTTHSMDLSILLGLAATCFGKAPPCYLVQPKGYDFSFGEMLSAKSHENVDQAIQAIYRIIRAPINGY